MIREQLQKPAVGYSVAGVAILIAVVLTVLWLNQDDARPVQTTSYFYDMNKGELFVTAITDMAPIKAPSDPEGATELHGARAFVYGCGSCANEKDRFIGYLEIYTDEAKEATKAGIDHRNKGRLVKLPGGEKWFEITSDEGMEVLKKAKEPCAKAKKRMQKCKAPMEGK